MTSVFMVYSVQLELENLKQTYWIIYLNPHKNPYVLSNKNGAATSIFPFGAALHQWSAYYIATVWYIIKHRLLLNPLNIQGWKIHTSNYLVAVLNVNFSYWLFV